MNRSKFDALLSRVLELANHPELLVIVVFAVPLVLFSSTSRKYRWWLIAAWAFFLPLTPFKDWTGVWTQPPFPFNKLVEHGRQIAFFLMLAMLPAAFQSRKFNESIKISPALLALFLVNVVYCFRYVPTVHASIAMIRLFSYCALFYLLAVSLPKRIGDRTDLNRYLMASAISALLVIVVSLLCYFLSPNSVSKAGRMAGLTSNPNFLGTLCGLSLPAFLGLTIMPDRSFRHKMFWILATGLLLIFIAWTGSRTAMGMAGIAVIVMFRKKLGSFLIIGVPLVAVVMVLGMVLEESQSSADRLMSLENTRGAVWGDFLELWRKNPIFGNSEIGMRTVENSYLTVLANAGVPGALAVLFFTFVALRTSFSLFYMKSLDPVMGVYRDIALSGILVALGGAVFVGFLVSSLSTDAYWIFLYFIMAEVVRDFALKHEHLVWSQATQAQYPSLSAMPQM